MTQHINHLRKYRMAAGLTQVALGDLIGANQQLIQRIEAGVSPAKLGVAELIASHLNLKVQQLFPTLRKQIDELECDEYKYEADGIFHNEVFFFFKNDQQINYTVPGPVIDKFQQDMDILGQKRDNNYEFFVFDTDTHRVAINPLHLSHWTVVSHSGSSLAIVSDAEQDEDFALNVLFSNGNWKTFSTKPDEYSVEDNEKELEAAQGDLPMPIGDFFYYLDDKYSPLVSFTNLDRQTTHMQKSDIVMVYIPLRFVRPVLNEAVDDQLL